MRCGATGGEGRGRNEGERRTHRTSEAGGRVPKSCWRELAVRAELASVVLKVVVVVVGSGRGSRSGGRRGRARGCSGCTWVTRQPDSLVESAAVRSSEVERSRGGGRRARGRCKRCGRRSAPTSHALALESLSCSRTSRALSLGALQARAGKKEHETEPEITRDRSKRALPPARHLLLLLLETPACALLQLSGRPRRTRGPWCPAGEGGRPSVLPRGERGTSAREREWGRGARTHDDGDHVREPRAASHEVGAGKVSEAGRADLAAVRAASEERTVRQCALTT